MYSIDGLCPSGNPMGGYGFTIHLSPAFRDACVAANLTQADVDRVTSTYGLEWLQKSGFSRYFDPENCGFRADRHAIPSEETRPSPSQREVRVKWGEWGPEHIYVPGNACGLDIDDCCGCAFRGGKSLLPHNVDSWSQVLVILLAFTWFAHYVILRADNTDDREE